MRQQDDFAPDVERQFVEGVKRFRTEQGMTQAELADQMRMLGFKFYQATVYKIENGERKVTAAESYALAQIFDVAVEELFIPSSSPEAVRHSVRTIADRMGQAILALDEICLRIRTIHSSLFMASERNRDAVMRGSGEDLVTVEEYLAGFRSFYLHNEILYRLRSEVWEDPEFSELMGDVSGIRGLAPLTPNTEFFYRKFDLPPEVDPIDLTRSNG